MSHAQHDSIPTRWSRRIWWACVALLVSALLAIATPLVGEPRFRAGVVREVKRIVTRLQFVPAPYAKLDVPLLVQEHALSCEVATLRMVLKYRGIDVTEEELMSEVGYDPAPRRWQDGTLTWGDPDEAFVGDLDGIMGKTGYGVHAGPIGRVAGRYRRTEVIANGAPEMLVDAVVNANPVIIWGYLGRGRALTWQSLGGKEVHAIDGEHTRVVVGYTGTREAIDGFHVLDPIYGEQYWELDDFMENWEKLGRTGVIIY